MNLFKLGGSRRKSRSRKNRKSRESRKQRFLYKQYIDVQYSKLQYKTLQIQKKSDQIFLMFTKYFDNFSVGRKLVSCIRLKSNLFSADTVSEKKETYLFGGTDLQKKQIFSELMLKCLLNYLVYSWRKNIKDIYELKQQLFVLTTVYLQERKTAERHTVRYRLIT